MALKLNQENYLNRSWSAPNPVSSQFDVDFDLELTSKRVSGVVGTLRMPLINPNEVDITPPPPTSVKNAVKLPNARAKLFSQVTVRSSFRLNFINNSYNNPFRIQF